MVTKDVEKGLVDTVGGGESGSIDIYTLSCVKQIGIERLLYITQGAQLGTL